MSKRQPLTVTVITLNEEANLPRLLESVRFADEIVVVDSGSTDRTRAIAEAAGAKVVQNAWPGYGKQKNFAQDLASHDWVLNLDADECVSPELRAEIETVLTRAAEGTLREDGFSIPRRTYYWGKWIRHGGWYPNALVRLARKSKARWSEPEVHEEWKVEGEVGSFQEPIDHYTFSCIQDQIRTNLRFSKLGADELVRRGKKKSIVKLLFKPWGKFMETYFLKLGFLDGLAGFIISVNAAHSMFLKYAYLFEADLIEEGSQRAPARSRS